MTPNKYYSTHVHQQYFKQTPKTSQGYPHLQVGIQVPLGHFAKELFLCKGFFQKVFFPRYFCKVGSLQWGFP